MAFRPKSDAEEPGGKAHALVEVVFGISYLEPFTPAHLDTLAQNHGRFKQTLPRLSRGHSPLLPAEISAQIGLPPVVSFDRVKPDGTISWRIKIEGSWIYINCLDYSRYNDVWDRARAYFQAIEQLGIASGNRVRSVMFQAIDVFQWDGGEEDYDLKQLINPNAEWLPNRIWDKGPRWHSYQGWYRPVDLIGHPARILERLHIDGVVEEPGATTLVKIDNFQDQIFDPTVDLPQILTTEKLDIIFRALHESNKATLKTILVPAMAANIGLTSP